MNSVRVEFKSVQLEENRKALCLSVLEAFHLPALRLLCYLDDVNPQELLNELRAEFLCGIHAPVLGSGTLALPPYVSSFFIDQSTGEITFDNFIYVCARATDTEVGTAITLAHELQHFVQCGTGKKILHVNNLLYQNVRSFEPAWDAKPWDIPSEYEAMLVSKRIAQKLFAPDIVTDFAKSQIASGEDIGKWEFFLELDTETNFELLRQTDILVHRYRSNLQQLVAHPAEWEFSTLDFSKPEWWAD